jgi:hypothetical protein
MEWTIENIDDKYSVVRTYGKYNSANHYNMVEDLLSKDFWRPGMPIIYDHRELDISESSYDTVQNAAIIRTKYEAKFGDSRAAIVTVNDYMFGVFRQFEAVVEPDVRGTFGVFKSYEDAETWIQESL